MKNRAAVLGLSWLLIACPFLPALGALRTTARTVYHPDKSRTESTTNPDTRELTEITYSAENAVILKKVFLLNDKGEPLQGNIYDGRGNLVARCQCHYDELGRRKEDRLLNVKGEVFQQVLYEYDATGKAQKPKVINLGAQSPTIKPAPIDFTKSGEGAPATQGGSRFDPVPLPASGGTGVRDVAPVTPPAQQQPKTNFFKRLFQKK
ncbi:MAG: hypothetical protein LDL31_10185 [Prosthecobacter sp.]|nr:hypothetical protein [Prosthecobacter sp.]